MQTIFPVIDGQSHKKVEDGKTICGIEFDPTKTRYTGYFFPSLFPTPTCPTCFPAEQ